VISFSNLLRRPHLLLLLCQSAVFLKAIQVPQAGLKIVDPLLFFQLHNLSSQM
jgi:hypothetical protein